MNILTRRRFVATAPAWLGGLPGCSTGPDPQAYEAVAARTWRAGPASGLDGRLLALELVRCATLAPSSHNTQCWRFTLDASAPHRAITIAPDLSRRCPAVDPDDHHLFVSLGCATENLVQAAAAHGLQAEARFDAASDAVRVTLQTTAARASALYHAIPQRQCTRGDYDGKPLSTAELGLLEAAGSSDGVRLLLLTERAAMERVLAQVVEGNTAQLADPAFVAELKSWIRFNDAAAVRTGDGLFSRCTGNPSIPSWLGDLAFSWVVTPAGENDKIARQIRSAAGLAVFVGRAADKAHWVDVGRCCERFALQATALGIRDAFLNQPVEVAALRPAFAASLGVGGERPDLVLRFGRGPSLPPSLRRPLEAVLSGPQALR